MNRPVDPSDPRDSYRRSERPGGVTHRPIGPLGLIDEAEKAVREVGIMVVIDRDTRSIQTLGISVPFVP